MNVKVQVNRETIQITRHCSVRTALESQSMGHLWLVDDLDQQPVKIGLMETSSDLSFNIRVSNLQLDGSNQVKVNYFRNIKIMFGIEVKQVCHSSFF